MSHLPSPQISDRDLLGELAMEFRGTRNPQDREAIAKTYAQAVERLIRSGAWNECPSPEDQLPDDLMPESFFEYWIQG